MLVGGAQQLSHHLEPATVGEDRQHARELCQALLICRACYCRGRGRGLATGGGGLRLPPWAGLGSLMLLPSKSRTLLLIIRLCMYATMLGKAKTQL